MILNQHGQPMRPRNLCDLGLGLSLGLGSKQPTVAAGGGGAALSATIDYTGVGDTTDYVHPDTTEQGTNDGHDVASGLYTQADNNTQSGFIIKQSVLDLSGKTTVSGKVTGYTSDTGGSRFALYLSDDFTPGSIVVTTSGTVTGYKMLVGSGSSILVYRVTAGSDVQIGSIAHGGISGVDLEMRVTIGGSDNTIQIFKDDSQIGSDITDSDAGRASDLPCVAFAMRNFFNSKPTLQTIVGAEITA